MLYGSGQRTSQRGHGPHSQTVSPTDSTHPAAAAATATTAVAAALDDSELPVRVQAAIAITELVTSHASGKSSCLNAKLW